MLDATTKARIDSARDILVGKVPDPKSQVEQITIALIYKFMADMDRQAEELGGKPSFFKGEFRKYRWPDLLDKRLGGHERLLLYAEGIERMNENKNIPQLFRDIFRGVFLPYRDPETLNLFLKEIDGFTYDHSERLGDAYEYLLNILGTQGDAGQFRTPRHIIDFIVAVVAPQKHETVLDPACGTAGFLISAYKHILSESSERSDPSGSSDSHRPLTPDERARLMTNFCGYDIAPDMVRLSRVNLYLHGFPNPVIHEYDALTSEERWDERYDVIMANPPFMTPKGGIRPHNRFSIKANRSEVLFVDYIAEHLNPGGRAGIIVPEGIIFQSQNAYKALRKMLVENYLWAVVSLPAGVFNPYSGVKTSILLLDSALAKRADSVLFVKIENDGFDLGAQRRPIEGSELPAALRALQDWKNSRPNGPAGQTHHAVPRKRLLEAPDISLSGDRYRQVAVRGNGKYPKVTLGEESLFEVFSGGTPSSSNATYWDGDVNWATLVDLPADELVSDLRGTVRRITKKGLEESAAVLLPKRSVLVSTRATIGRIAIAHVEVATNQGFKNLVIKDFGRVNERFLAYAITRLVPEMERMASGGTFKELSKSNFLRLEIPLPPLAEQERLVAEWEGYRKLIEAARQIVAHYKPILRIDPNWQMATLEDLCERIQYGLSEKLNTDGKGYRTFRMNELVEGRAVDNGEMKRIVVSEAEFKKYQLAKGDILFNRTNSFEHVGRTGIFSLDGEYTFASYLIRLIVDRKRVDPDFVNAVMNTSSFQKEIKMYASRAIGQANISASSLKKAVIPLPPLPVQRALVAELEAERALVEANRQLIARFERKLQARVAAVWGAPSSPSSESSAPSDSRK
ncbi:MAG: N-6 DNA methylase [Verrucomicrobiae bacterium]|nr:N-6 DNA methylase [Verrucomicrobiae bacterium]